ncbi:MAG: ssDNA-binding domain-containing protein [Bacteroidia bacterium]|nr:ssDNA-binding domain-containing protein [Bacteroidia bacterium]MCF8427147.1 ssDNA-binding domain-containing protein [Bacteroidia bacterium]MCF8445792.1 ssDNA-binding domain-containing protein [Bacteroidia bacterium]
MKRKSKYHHLEGIADVLSAADIRELGISNDKSLGKVNKKSVYETVNDILINELEKGSIPWQKPWQGNAMAGDGTFANWRSKKPYKGVNPWLISVKIKDHHSPYFLTKAQIEKRGGQIKPGATRFGIVYFGSAIQSKTFEPTPEKPEGETLSRIIRFLKEYIVYNTADTTLDIDWKKEIPVKTEEEKIENAEKVYEMYPNKPPLKHGGNEAYYSPSKDFVQMPHKKDFKKLPLYYTTLFHELIHSTGHGKRLKREFGATFGTKKYAYEELIAEIGATYLCAHTGILFHSRKNSIAYLQNWMKALATEAKENKSFFFKAASQSQKAANYILSKQLAKEKKTKKPAAKKALSGIKIKRTNIKLLKAKLAKKQNLGKLIKINRKFEPYTLTDHVAEFLLGRRIKMDSFKRHGDSNHITGKSGNVYRLHWFGNRGIKKERPLDQLAQDFTNEYFQYGNLDEGEVINEMVEIITNYPNGAGAYMDDVNRARQYEEDRFNERMKDSEPKKIVATKKPKKKKTVMQKTTVKKQPTTRKIVVAKRIFSTELNIIKSFLALDGKTIDQERIANQYKKVGQAKKLKQVDNHRATIGEIHSKLHKALGYALESPENKIVINLEQEFKKKCQDAIKNAQVKVRTEYLAGNKPSKKTKGLTGIPETIRSQVGGKALMMLGAHNLFAVKNGISFKIKGSPKFNHIEIVLNSKDLYDIKFTKFNSKGILKEETVNDVYFDQMHKVIESRTNLFTKLFGTDKNSTKVFIDQDGKKFQLIDLHNGLPWANEKFKTRKEVVDFTKANKLTIASPAEVKYPDGFTFKILTKNQAYALFNKDKEVFGLDLDTFSEAAIEDIKDLKNFTVFGIPKEIRRGN